MCFTEENANRRHHSDPEYSFPTGTSVDEAEFMRQEKGQYVLPPKIS